MSAISFNTTNQTYRQLIGNGLTYKVPHFQRDYSWTDQEWDDLWEDIQDVLSPEGESAHYMGYLVLQSQDSKNFDIIDGQQRLTTLSIMALALLKNLERLIETGVDPDNNRKRQEQLRNSFIGYLDPVTLIPRSKLTLNRNNNPFYQNYLVPLLRLPHRGLSSSEHQMRKAFEWFENRIREVYGTQHNGAVLAGMIDQLSDKLFFTVITVTDELNAYRVFETLNSRGVKLSSTDLLKNYLFSIVHSQSGDLHEVTILEDRWEMLVDKLSSENFTDFLRTHWNSRKRFVRHADLFKTIRGQITDKREVFELLRDMEADADVYVALSKPEDILWNQEQRIRIDELRMFNVRQVLSLLMAGYRILAPEDFTRLLRACSVISFRYNVIGSMSTSDQERQYAAVVLQISEGHIHTLREIILALRNLYPEDTVFEHAFADKILKTSQSGNKRIVRYILFQIEKYLSQQEYELDSELYNLEHILPENPGQGWEHISDRDYEQYVYRLGNMTLMNTRENRGLGNAPYSVKKPSYAESSFFITRRVAEESSEWTPERIAIHQRWLARQAKTIWRISQLEE